MASTDKEFPYFTKIDTLFAEGINLKVKTQLDLRDILPSFIKKIISAGEYLFRFEIPQLMASMFSLTIYIYKEKDECRKKKLELYHLLEILYTYT